MNDINNLSEFVNEQQIKTFDNPFLKNKIYRINFEIKPSKGIFNPTDFQARIDFTNGPTSGNHEITAENFKQLVEKVELFINSLK